LLFGPIEFAPLGHSVVERTRHSDIHFIEDDAGEIGRLKMRTPKRVATKPGCRQFAVTASKDPMTPSAGLECA
jgi:hypothetical protein